MASRLIPTIPNFSMQSADRQLSATFQAVVSDRPSPNVFLHRLLYIIVCHRVFYFTSTLNFQTLITFFISIYQSGNNIWNFFQFTSTDEHHNMHHHQPFLILRCSLPSARILNQFQLYWNLCILFHLNWELLFRFSAQAFHKYKFYLGLLMSMN